ncbi:DNA-binding transcriptional regulator, LysR family [Variovorax sp. HW608]|uniref:LysR family transcriptional regulator n=1 Tax=Variovorax sp. HW608 TaxID=1034889 RepID=UPI00081F8868|nr:LysR family transcriptional regulator [Variovorax sp. HW608]SCK14610.1 DNA-binding transcriptional regulator, LysR family [Variovorax sp. HW608]
MDLRQIMYFLRVYEERNFTRAADRAFVVQPALSRQVAALEEEIGAPLFDRGPRGVTPTAIGVKFHELVLPLIGNLSEVKQHITELARAGPVSGKLVCGFPPSFSRAVLGKVICRFVDRYPEVELQVSEGFSGHLTAQVRGGELDFALGLVPTDLGSLTTEFEHDESLVLISGAPVAGPSFTPCRLELLQNLKLVIPSAQNLIGRQLQSLIAEGIVKPARLMVMDAFNASYDIVRTSDWCVVTPASAILCNEDRHSLFIYPVSSPILRYRLGLIRDRSKALSTAGYAFVEMLQEASELIQIEWRRLLEAHSGAVS